MNDFDGDGVCDIPTYVEDTGMAGFGCAYGLKIKPRRNIAQSSP